MIDIKIIRENPELVKENIKKMIPVDRRRVIMMLKLMHDGQKYAMKVFSIKDEEIGINANQDNNDTKPNAPIPSRSNSTPPAASEIQREAMSMPELSNDRQRPPPATSANNSDSNSKPYFFQRPKMQKKP